MTAPASDFKFLDSQEVLDFISKLPPHVEAIEWGGLRLSLSTERAEHVGEGLVTVPVESDSDDESRIGFKVGRDGLTAREQLEAYGRVLDAPGGE